MSCSRVFPPRTTWATQPRCPRGRPGRPGRFPHRLRLARADHRARVALRRLSQAGGRHPDFTVRLSARARGGVGSGHRGDRGDYVLPEAAPLPLPQGLLAAEMAMNLQMALGQRRHVLLHAATVEQGGRAVVLTGLSGAGKSTLAALLSVGGWRLLGDEFALLEPATGLLHPFLHPVSLKNGSLETVAAAAPNARFGPRLRGTPKGDIRRLVPDAAALAAMDAPRGRR